MLSRIEKLSMLGSVPISEPSVVLDESVQFEDTPVIEFAYEEIEKMEA